MLSIAVEMQTPNEFKCHCEACREPVTWMLHYIDEKNVSWYSYLCEIHGTEYSFTADTVVN